MFKIYYSSCITHLISENVTISDDSLDDLDVTHLMTSESLMVQLPSQCNSLVIAVFVKEYNKNLSMFSFSYFSGSTHPLSNPTINLINHTQFRKFLNKLSILANFSVSPWRTFLSNIFPNYYNQYA